MRVFTKYVGTLIAKSFALNQDETRMYKTKIQKVSHAKT